MNNVVAVLYPKGGTGKTTTTCNLAGALTAMGLRVGVVDNDWQASASVHCGIKEPDEVPGLAELLEGKRTVDQVTQMVNGFALIPGSGELTNVDLELLSQGEAGVYRLRQVLRTFAEEKDIVLIDCEPGMHIRNLGALAAADYVLAPIAADYLSLKPLKLFLRVLAAAGSRYRQMPKHHVGVVVTRYDARQTQAQQVAETVKKLAPEAGLQRFSVTIPERSAHRKTAVAGGTVYDADDASVRDLQDLYKTLAEQVMAW